MLWVIFVHWLYWMDLLAEGRLLVVKSFFLIEMPIMFFAVGASNSISKITNNFEFIYKRLKRVYIPYLLYALLCSIMTIEATGDSDGTSRILPLITMSGFPISVPNNASSALWFMPHYCIFICIFPLFKQIYVRLKKYKFLKILPYVIFILGATIVSFKQASYWNYFFVYGFWVYLGQEYLHIFENQINEVKKKCLFISICSMGTMMMLYYKFGFELNMQSNKFPPNIMFLTYTIFVLSLFVLLSEMIFKSVIWIKKKFHILEEIFKIYEECSFSIFLIQPIAFATSYSLLCFLSLNKLVEVNDIFSVLVYFILTVPIAALMGKGFYVIEKRCK